MKKHSGIINLVALLCGLTYIFVLIGIPAVAYSTENIDNSSEAILENESSSDAAETLSSPGGSSSPGLTYSIIDPTVPAPATTRIVFDDTNIVDCTFVSENEPHYSYRYSSNGSANHSIYCACGHIVRTEAHSMTFLGGKSRCSLCSYVSQPGLIIKDKIDGNLII